MPNSKDNPFFYRLIRTGNPPLRSFFSLLLAALLYFVPACAEEGFGFYESMPEHLIFQQKTVEEQVARDISILRTYPDTANDDVDTHMRNLIDAMAERNRDALPLGRVTIPSYLDVGSVVSRTGTSVLSFLTLAEVSREKEQIHVDYETCVFDIAAGRQLSMEDLFAPESEAWSYLAAEIRKQLTAAFPEMEPDQNALDRLCQIESIQNADFTLGAARMTLTYRADLLYPGKNTLLHVHAYYPDIRPMMTEYAQEQTENSRFRMVALTYDDGGARGSTRRVLNVLRKYGAQATFFIVGRTIANNHEMLCIQQDSKHSIQSHTYFHKYPRDLTTEDALMEKAMMDRELGELIGVVPTMMRGPGGMDHFYTKRKMGYPLIHWSLASGDSGNDDAYGIVKRIANVYKDGDIILMHDSNRLCATYTEGILERMSARGTLCVTVEELFADAGIPMQKDQIYYSPYRMEDGSGETLN